MRCMVRAACVAATLAAFLPASAQAQKQFGAANVLCSQYTKAARSSDIVYHQASNWLLGYVSGMNAGLQSSNAAAVVKLTNDQVLKSAFEYCSANPGATIAAAAGQWYAQMPKQAEPPQQAQSQAPSKDDNWIRLNLEAPARKPLLERR